MILLTVVSSLFARGFREEIVEGNRALIAGEYEAAREVYERAGITNPESPHLYFNNALLAYHEGDYTRAKEGFQEAALRTRDLRIEALAHYNLGNVSVREAERQIDSDLEQAISLYEAAVASYQRALELDTSVEDAAVNTEIVRIILKDLLDKLAQQEEQGGNEELDEIVRRLQELIVAEYGHIAAASDYVESGQSAAPDELFQSQFQTRAQTETLSADLQSLEQTMVTQGMTSGQAPSGQPSQSAAPSGAAPSGAAPSGAAPNGMAESPLTTARRYIDASVIEQAIAASNLSQSRIEPAIPYQENAATLLEQALDELTDDQEQENEQSQNQESQSGSQPEEEAEAEEQNEEAQDILQEEEENRRQRAVSDSNRYGAVDRDW
jgi:tetratricopeptide (TPR) repeat protein